VASHASSDSRLLSDGKHSSVTEPDIVLSEIEAVNVRHEYYGTTSIKAALTSKIKLK
jgi:hypothetical protein